MQFLNLIVLANIIACSALPSFDYTQLGLDSNSLHQALVQHGMISLRNIPQYAETRRTYLLEAARCARVASTSHRRLQDGTERFTISSSKPVCAHEFNTLQNELNNIIQNAVLSCGKALESKDKIVSDVIETAETLDHFHLYVKPTTKTTAASSIDFHTDNGLLIAFTTPMLLREDYTPIEISDDSESGLFIKDPTTNQIVQPHLPPNELILMIGEGLSQWTGSKSFSPVVHGMIMPQIDEMKQRAWFGKMFLLPETAVMENTQMTFGSYVNATKRFLIDDQGVSDHRMALACPAGRHLVASDNECKRKICKPNTGSDATEKNCNKWCNHDMANDIKKCNESCSCDTQNFLDGEVCWMLCLENLTCPGTQVQFCDEDIPVLECVPGPEPPSPSPPIGSASRNSCFIFLPIFLLQIGRSQW